MEIGEAMPRHGIAGAVCRSKRGVISNTCCRARRLATIRPVSRSETTVGLVLPAPVQSNGQRLPYGPCVAPSRPRLVGRPFNCRDTSTRATANTATARDERDTRAVRGRLIEALSETLSDTSSMTWRCVHPMRMSRNRCAASIRSIGQMANADEFVHDRCLTPDVLRYSGCTFSRSVSGCFGMRCM